MSPRIETWTREQARLLTPPVAEKLREYHWRRVFSLFECFMRDDDHGTRGAEPPIIPYVPARRSLVYRGSRETGSYNHHGQIASWRGRLWYSWSNGFRNEEDAGQRVLMTSSTDGERWEAPWVVSAPGEGKAVAHNSVALYTEERALHQVVMNEETIRDAAAVGMRRIDPESVGLAILSSTDGRSWTESYRFRQRIKWIFEAPRPTRDGHLLCVCTTLDHGPAIMRWPGLDILQEPELIRVPEPEGASFPYGESTWYQTDDETIVIYWRDEGASCRMYVSWSLDGGRTFSVPVLSDIPDSMSRIYAGRLADGRYFLCNNAIATLLDRSVLTLLVSEDGYRFDKVYVLNDDPVRMRRKGLLKVNGLQYPSCVVRGGELVVAYDANKEDILLDIVQAKDL